MPRIAPIMPISLQVQYLLDLCLALDNNEIHARNASCSMRLPADLVCKEFTLRFAISSDHGGNCDG